MALSIRRGTTKTFALRIPPFNEDPDGVVDIFSELPTLLPEDEGKVYKVKGPCETISESYPADSYWKWDGSEWIFIGYDKKWKDLGTLHVRILQDDITIDKEYKDLDSTVAEVVYTQDETITLKEKKSAKLQVFCVKGNVVDENAKKSQTYSVQVLESLWNEAVHNE